MEDNWKQFHLQLIWPVTSYHFYGNTRMDVRAVTHSNMENWRRCGGLGRTDIYQSPFLGAAFKTLNTAEKKPKALSLGLLSSAASCYRR